MLIINNQEDMNNLDINTIQNVDEIKISNVSIIPEGKFYGLNKLTKVYMNNINIIESGAFMDCKNLKDISFKNNPKEIHDFAFHNTKVGFILELYQNTKFGVYNNLGKNITLENTSWSNLNELVKLNKYKDYFKVGDEKQIQLKNHLKCTVQIYDFDHDNLSNGSGKAGITFGFKDIIHNDCINFSDTNTNGWKGSDIRDFLNDENDINSIYNKLPKNLKTYIKEVNKVSDNGYLNQGSIISTDKLFLLSIVEIGITSRYCTVKQGSKYSIFNNGINRVKHNLNNYPSDWWLRTTSTATKDSFFYVHSSGNYGLSISRNIYGISPCFCI